MTAAPVILRTHDLVKRYGGLLATNRANLAVRQGEIHALIGPNGAGKTTLIHQLSGALAPTSGRVEFAGRDVSGLKIQRRVHLGLVRSYQITSVFMRFTVLENLALAVQARDGSSMRFWRPAHAEQARYAAAARIAEQVGLAQQLQQRASALSHGQRRQLEVGLTLALQPKLLLLDEPMAGMGPDESARMVALLQALRGQVTMLLVEHDMDAVFRLADRISVLVFGEIIATGSAHDIRNDVRVRQAYLGDEVPAGAP